MADFILSFYAQHPFSFWSIVVCAVIWALVILFGVFLFVFMRIRNRRRKDGAG